MDPKTIVSAITYNEPWAITVVLRCLSIYLRDYIAIDTSIVVGNYNIHLFNFIAWDNMY